MLSSDELKSLMSKVKRINKGEEFLVVPLLEKHYASIQEREGSSGSFSPSMLGGCLRNAYYKYKGVSGTRQRDPISIATLEDGRARHERWAKTLADAGILKESEKELWIPEWHIHGFCDGILSISGKDWVYELKGVRSEYFRQISKGKSPREEDALQLHVYMKALGIPRGIVIYENKNDQREIREFVYHKPNPIVSIALENRMEVLLKAIENDEPPDKPEGCVPKSTMKQWCDRASYCRNEEEVGEDV